jgi:ribonuclease P protein component
VKRRLRLRREGDFQRTLQGRRLYVGQALVAVARPRTEGGWRVGVAISRQLKGSVRRNRARRRVREAARIGLLGNDSGAAGVGIPYDVVLIARPAALQLPASALLGEAAAVREKLERASAR